MKPDVSVVVTVYKRPQFIEALMEGMFNQTLSNWECIIIDDGSNMPELTEICQRYVQQDKRIKYIQQENSGVAVARNRGIAEASADFVAIHDDDDVSHPQRLEKQVGFLRQYPQVAAVGCYGIIINEAGEIISKPNSQNISQEPIIQDIQKANLLILATNSMHGMNSKCCCRRDCLIEVGGYDADFKVSEDLDLGFRLHEKYPLATLREELYSYRTHSDSNLSSNPICMMYIAFAFIAAHLRRNNIPEPSGNRLFNLLTDIKNLPETMIIRVFRAFRSHAKILLRMRQHEELGKLLGDFNTAFFFSPKYRIKMYRYLILGSLWYGGLGALPTIIKRLTRKT